MVDLLTVLAAGCAVILAAGCAGILAGNNMRDTLSLCTRRWAIAVDVALVELIEAGQRERREGVQ